MTTSIHQHHTARYEAARGSQGYNLAGTQDGFQAPEVKHSHSGRTNHMQGLESHGRTAGSPSILRPSTQEPSARLLPASLICRRKQGA